MRRLLRLFARHLSKSSAGSQVAQRFTPLPAHPVEVQIVGHNSIDILRARDVSMTGISVFVPHRFEGYDIDSEVELVITLPEQRSFLLGGRIRHSTDHADVSHFFGLHFTRVTSEIRERLQAYLDSSLTRPTDRSGAA